MLGTGRWLSAGLTSGCFDRLKRSRVPARCTSRRIASWSITQRQGTLSDDFAYRLSVRGAPIVRTDRTGEPSRSRFARAALSRSTCFLTCLSCRSRSRILRAKTQVSACPDALSFARASTVLNVYRSLVGSGFGQEDTRSAANVLSTVFP